MDPTYPPPPPASHVPPPPNEPPPAYYPPPPGYGSQPPGSPIYPTSPPPVAAKPATGTAAVVSAGVEQLQGAAEQHVRRYFFVAMILGFFLGFYAFLPLLFYKGLEQSSRKRKYFISGVFAGICLCIVLNALLVTFLFLFVLNGARDASAVAAVDGTFTSF